MAYGISSLPNSHDVRLQAEISIKNLPNITNANARSEIQTHRPGSPFSLQTLQAIKLRTELSKAIGNTPTITQELRVFTFVPSLSVPFELPFGNQTSPSTSKEPNNNVLNNTPITAATAPAATSSTAATTTTTSTATSVGFNGLTEGQIGGFFYPPDVQVAVGPNYIMEMSNLEGKTFTKAGGSISTFSLHPFFVVSSSDEITDPRVMYDTGSGRWFAAIADLTLSTVKVAVSTSSIPNTFKIFNFKFSNCPDYPSIGLNDDKFAVSVNLFTSVCNGGYAGVQYYVINKNYLTGATSTPIYSRSSPNTSLFSLQPVQSLSSSSTLYMVTVGDDLSNHATVYSFAKPPSTSNIPTSTVNYAIHTTHIPPNAIERGTSNQVDTGDARILDTSWYNGRLWLTFNDACTPSGDVQTRSCARLIQVNTSTNSLSQDFDVGAKAAYYFYPALRMDSSMDLLVVFGASSSSIYPSIFATGQAATGGLLDSSPLTLKTGTYPETTTRYGDYFGTAVDPTNPSLVWGAGEYHSSSLWSTFIATMLRR
ncbi:MAG TPA: hypothetical protein VFI73_05385 [Candidatus Nitrosopolaris sp.]|nr:hypothetical protein [Candidatus Nitrosopolaris sp.]